MMVLDPIARRHSPPSFSWLPWALLLVLTGTSASATTSGQDLAQRQLDELVMVAEFEKCAPKNTRDAMELMRRFKQRGNHRFNPDSFANTTLVLDDGRFELSLDLQIGGLCISHKQTFVVEAMMDLPPCEFE